MFERGLSSLKKAFSLPARDARRGESPVLRVLANHSLQTLEHNALLKLAKRERFASRDEYICRQTKIPLSLTRADSAQREFDNAASRERDIARIQVSLNFRAIRDLSAVTLARRSATGRFIRRNWTGQYETAIGELI